MTSSMRAFLVVALAAPAVVHAQDAALAAVDSSIAARYENEEGNGFWGVANAAESAADSAALATWDAQLAAIDPPSLSDRRLRARLLGRPRIRRRGPRGGESAASISGTSTNSSASRRSSPPRSPTSLSALPSRATTCSTARTGCRRRCGASSRILGAGVAAGYTAPRANVQRVIGQLDAMLDSGARALYGPIARDANAAFDAAWRHAIADSVAAGAASLS